MVAKFTKAIEVGTKAIKVSTKAIDYKGTTKITVEYFATGNIGLDIKPVDFIMRMADF